VINKRHLHHVWRQLRHVHTSYFLVLTIVFATISVFALRNNNVTALKLRDHVLAVDQQNGDIETALRQLRGYIYGHMNTDLATSTSVYPPIQLKYRYDRLEQAEADRVAAANTNTVYNDAQTYCERTQPQSFYGAGRLGCIQSYIDTHPGGPVATANPIPDSLYKFDFASPTWSPDLAGWSLVLAALFGLLFIIRFVVERWMRWELKQKM
jgi:hypothetical protein